MKTSYKIQLISSLLILLFVYTAVSKLTDFERFQAQMYSQTLPHSLSTLLIWTLPEMELLVASILVFERTRLLGLHLSLLLLIFFSIYIALVLLHFFGRVPCSCGGVIRSLGWKFHLVFNFFFLLLSAFGIYFTNRERRVIGKQA